MALRAVKPKALTPRLKMFIYGPAKIGKSTAAIQFPKVYWIDTEKCADKKKYVKLLESVDGSVFQTTDFDELITEVKSLLTTKHDFKTLVIDSLTILYNDLLDKSASLLRSHSKEKDATGTEFGRHYGEANKKMKHLLALLLRLDLNVIITSHSKNEYAGNMTVIGSTFDCYKKLDYLFDLIIEVQKRGKERVAFIKGSRFEEFAEEEVFPFSYEEIAKRYNREVLEREAVVEVLASPDKVARLKELINLYKEPEEIVQKWLDKANATCFEEVNEEIMVKLINHMENKSKPKED